MNQKEQAKILLQKYGLPANDKYTGAQIVAILRMELKEILDDHIKNIEKYAKSMGKKCPDFEKDCQVCSAYKLLDEAKDIVKKNK